MDIDTNMSGKVVLVTGAASGLGRATALRFAQEGAQLCLVDADADGLAETQALLVPGSEALLHQADLSPPSACKEAVSAAVEKFDRLDGLCNVAGIIYLANSHEMPEELWARTLAVNLTAPFMLSQAAIPHLLEANGAIVNVASSAAFIGEAYAAAYCATKAGIVNMTKAMAMEYVRKPIRINAVAPGGMVTNIARNFTPPEGCDFELLKRYTGYRGTVDVDEVAGMIVLLASEAGKGFHGSCVTIDAGITAG
ncbi:SDR family NAD(P)-dependent oxidoreductase [Novosphingobium sp. M1R2S20]|uniref:SDR family NAD(P)-dependent oxidoreductase n=1 Tax=Novosphingobium rhizovicinum TaxID=3228928 RepID=A0ABV3R879_9SPHN